MKNVQIENAKIIFADLSMSDCGVLAYEIGLEGNGWGCVFGNRVIGKGYLDAKEFQGCAKGTEALMRIMDTVGVDKWSKLKDQYVRVETTGWGDQITKIGNIITDKWFDEIEFFKGVVRE